MVHNGVAAWASAHTRRASEAKQGGCERGVTATQQQQQQRAWCLVWLYYGTEKAGSPLTWNVRRVSSVEKNAKATYETGETCGCSRRRLSGEAEVVWWERKPYLIQPRSHCSDDVRAWLPKQGLCVCVDCFYFPWHSVLCT